LGKEERENSSDLEPDDSLFLAPIDPQTTNDK